MPRNTFSLTRREKQTLTIDDPLVPNSAIEVKIIEVRGDRVKLRVSIPRGSGVDRKEIWVEKKAARGEGMMSEPVSRKAAVRKTRMSKAQATVVAALLMIGLLAGMFLYAKYCFIPAWQHQIGASYKIETNK